MLWQKKECRRDDRFNLASLWETTPAGGCERVYKAKAKCWLYLSKTDRIGKGLSKLNKIIKVDFEGGILSRSAKLIILAFISDDILRINSPSPPNEVLLEAI